MGLLKNLTPEEHRKALPEGLILLGFRGSIAHEMYIPQEDPNSIDDKDVMGVFINPLDHYFGTRVKEHHESFVKEWDCVSYEIKKFVLLLGKANPNVISLLWVEPKHYILMMELGQRLIQHRDLFSTKKAYHSFTGYAYDQLHRMTHGAYEGYMGDKRKKLVEKFGYDSKNAAHLIRLLRMGIEFLNEGVLYVARKDAKQLLEIKRGEWSLEQVRKEADKLFARAEEAYDKCKLPNSPNWDKINELLVEILQDYFKVGNEIGLL